jgi:hypothetical protein
MSALNLLPHLLRGINKLPTFFTAIDDSFRHQGPEDLARRRVFRSGRKFRLNLQRRGRPPVNKEFDEILVRGGKVDPVVKT